MVTVTLVAVVAVALFFDFTNGFHDTANADRDERLDAGDVAARPRSRSRRCSTSPARSSRSKVAATIAKGIVDPAAITLSIVLAGLVGAITWNLITWFLGLPSSSSHALIGGILGSADRRAGLGRRSKWQGIWDKVLIPSLLAPFVRLRRRLRAHPRHRLADRAAIARPR